MPPCFSPASATPETASNDNTTAAHACTLRMLPSLNNFGLILGRLCQTISWRSVCATSKRRCQYWHFGLMQTIAAASTMTVLPVRPMSAAGAHLNPSHFQLVAAFQVENFTGLIRRRDFKAETFDDLAGELHLYGVQCRHSAGLRPQRVFQPDADIAAHRRRHRRNGELIAPGAQHRPD